jgi:hypothetical protein
MFFFLFKGVHPVIRIAIGIAVLVVGIAIHRYIFDIAGAAIVLLGAVTWTRRTRVTRK